MRVIPILLVVTACAAPPMPLLEGTGRHTRAVSDDPVAQRYFDQGLVLFYSFHRAEGQRSFEMAAEADPDCAMAWWGIAQSLGPSINGEMDTESGEQAYTALQRARELAHGAAPVDTELIEALAVRYADPPPEDRSSLDVAYADAMREVWRRHPDDDDVGTLFAEAMMVLRPWDHWTRAGEPQPGTLELVAALERALDMNPDHPGANHYYIHAVEASPRPQRALPSADRLGDLAPGVGHMIHMPAHAYMRSGVYGRVVEVNARAVEVDLAYNELLGFPADYDFGVPHSYHFLAYGAMFDGQSERAIQAARDLEACLTEATLSDPVGAEEVLSAKLHVLVRFGRWEEILAEPEPEARFPYTRALWRYSRGVALANLDRLEDAHNEARAFEVAVGAVPEGTLLFVIPARDVLHVARCMLQGEIAIREGRVEEALASLRAGVEAEDQLAYSEPAPWMQPVRHALGAILLQEGRLEEAEDVFRADLARNPENGWSLHGLTECLERRGATHEAAETRARFETAWQRADIEIRASCFCRRFS